MRYHIGGLFCLRLVAVASSSLLYLLAARLVGPVEFGRLATVVSVVAVVQTVADFGMNAFIARAAAIDEHRVAVAVALAFRGCLLLAVPIVVAVAAVFAAGETPLIAWACVMTVSNLFQTLFSAVLLGLGKTVRSALPLVIDRAAGAAALVVLGGWVSWSGSTVLACMAMGSSAATVVARFWCRGQLAKPALPPGMGKVLRESTSFMASALGAQLQNLDVPIVGALAGTYHAGILAAPSRLTTPLGVLAGSAASIMLVQRRHRRSRHDSDTITVTVAVSALTGLLVLPLLLAPRRMADAFLGPGFGAGATTFQLVALAVIVASANQTLAASLQSRGRQRDVSRAVLAGALVGVVCVAILASSLGALAGGVGVLVSQVLILSVLAMRRRECP